MRLVEWGRQLIRRLADGEIPLITDEAWLPDPVDDIWPQMPYTWTVEREGLLSTIRQHGWEE
ncbi:hypothetical protein [Mycolicibacterium brisbanense]|uniref:Uncharacterized protein n=1 Tax=Mycolicibacterium brisbanense TaxID=146020 RepID=A0A117I4L9_9MYCO|nr:hypothetical protein [Mycolicibacterium brisbanense]MCV7159636.1 hypothetical protein [Mycolicibacterium brisbanense]GAS87140.1 uncharacterized protein RMCB_1236 [Mycolicibacterium brisbanense]